MNRVPGEQRGSMSQTQTLQMAVHHRRRRLGDSVPGCLLAIALVLGGSIWGYFKFFHYGALVNAGKNHKTFVAKDNWPAYLEYGRRFRGSVSVSVKGMLQQNYAMISDVKKGKYKDRESVFEADTKAFINVLLESVTDFDGQQVPTVLEKSHIMVSKAHGLCYESVLLLKEAQGEEGAERARLIKEAEKKMQDAWKQGMAGVKEHKRVWSAHGT